MFTGNTAVKTGVSGKGVDCAGQIFIDSRDRD
jgi:hypothetical protein